jgi:uncharacterized protein YndB with AHSA1/START domain
MTEPLVVEFEVAAAPDHVFGIWTERCALWWPPTHTMTGDPAVVVFEPRPGGRIYERGADGREHAWGEVIDWDPPARVRYWWHMFFPREEATEVTVTFAARGTDTLVTIRQDGWDRLGDAGVPRRERTGQVWGGLVELFIVQVEDPATRPPG